MNRILLVCLIALTVATVALPARAQVPALQKGVSVQMAVTRNASPMPEADNDDAWVVAVTSDGSLFFGAEAMTADQLANWMRTHPRSREANLYIKADARAPFADVGRVLEIGRVMGFEAPVLLTSQIERKTPGTMVPPKGLGVLLNAPSKEDSIVVHLGRRQDSSTLSINNQTVSAEALESNLRQLIQNGSDRVVIVRANGAVPFKDFAYVLDVCRSVGAEADLVTAQL